MSDKDPFVEKLSPAERQAYEVAHRLGRTLGKVIELEYEAQHDNLTGLLNRKALVSAIDEKIKDPNGQFGLLFIDLKDFKAYNDTHGHEAGNHALIAVANRLHSKFRTQEDDALAYLSRLHGDEFALLFDVTPPPKTSGRRSIDLSPQQRLEQVRQRALETKNDPLLQELGIDLSVGAALRTPWMNTSDLLRAADQAMYVHKGEQRSANGSYR